MDEITCDKIMQRQVKLLGISIKRSIEAGRVVMKSFKHFGGFLEKRSKNASRASKISIIASFIFKSAISSQQCQNNSPHVRMSTFCRRSNSKKM